MRTLLLLSLLILYSASYAQYFPESNWQSKTPKEAGLNEKALGEFLDFVQENEYSGEKDLRVAILKGFSREPYHKIVGPTKKRGGPAGMIIKNGYIVSQWGDIDRVDMTFSVTKSYLSTVAGLAHDKGMIDLNQPAANWIWDGTFAGEHNAGITWDHLLTQSSDWSGNLFGMYDWADRPPREGGIDDWKNRKLNEPGTFYKYNDVRVNVLSYSLLNVWRKPLPQVLKEHIMDPIGASSTWRWHGYESSWVTIDGTKMQSVSGGGHSGGGLFISASDHARFGLLFARKGKWNDKQLISEDWISKARSSSTANPVYGYMWWLNKNNRQWEGWGDHIYYGSGFGGNFVIVDDENDMVVVFRWLQPNQLKPAMELLAKAIK